MAEENKEKDPKKDPKNDPTKDENGLEDDKISERFLSLFDGTDLSEEFKTKASTLFLAAVHEAAKERAATAIEEAQVAAREQVEAEISRISENVDRYITHAARTYLEENKVAIQTGIRVDAANRVVESAKTIMESAGALDLPEEQATALEEAEARLAELETKLNESIEKNIALSESVNAMSHEKVFNEVSEGMVMTDKERLKTLAESIDASATVDEYRTAVQTLRESFVEQPVAAPAKLDEGKAVNVDPAKLDEGEVQVKKTTRRRF